MKTLLFLVVSLLGIALPAVAQEKSHAQAKLFARSEGDTVRLALQVRIDAGWHLYSGPTMADVGPEGVIGTPTTLTLEGPTIAWGDWRFPKPEIEHQDFGTPLDVNIHRGKIAIYRVGKAQGAVKLEDLKLQIAGQTCSDGEGGKCEQYAEKLTFAGAGPDELFAALPSDLSAQPKPTAPQASESNAKTSSKSVSAAKSNDEGEGDESSLLAFLLSAVAWGLFTLLMPCTYPMIPITISYFTKQATARQTSTLPLSLAYGAGIVLIFIVIGLLAAPFIIPFATHPITNLVIGGFFLVFSLTLFGVMNLQPPQFLLSVAGSASQKGGYVGVFLMGATLVVTSFTCTAPFVGTLLSTGASSGSYTRVALGMGVFGLTMAIPFVFLSMVPAKLKSIPKSGEWMHTLKVFLGFVEVAAALKFISNADLVWNWQLLSRELFLALCAAIFLAAAAYLWGWIRFKDEFGQEEPATVSPKRFVAGFATFLFAGYLGFGMLGNSMDPITTGIVPNYSSRIPTGEGTASAAQGHVVIKDDFEGALARAKSEGKLLLANFTGFSCVNCRVMEEKVFPLPAVSKLLASDFIEARLHTDGGPSLEHNKELQKKYARSVANPDYVIIDPKTGERLRKRGGLMTESTFLEFLQGKTK